MSADPADQADVLVERLFSLLHDCRAIVRRLEPGNSQSKSASEEAERLLYYGLIAATGAGLVRCAEDGLTVLRQASDPLGLMGEKWMAEQERRLDDGQTAS